MANINTNEALKRTAQAVGSLKQSLTKVSSEFAMTESELTSMLSEVFGSEYDGEGGTVPTTDGLTEAQVRAIIVGYNYLTSSALSGYYQKPSTGIPETDLAEAVKAKLNTSGTLTESDIAEMGFTKNTGTYTKPSSGIPASDLADGVIPSLTGYATQSWVNQQGFAVGTIPSIVSMTQEEYNLLESKVEGTIYLIVGDVS